jgi:outer membrane protein TolC
MRKSIVIMLLCCAVGAQAQDTLQFRSCLELAAAHAPRLLDRELIDAQGKLKLEKVKRGWYPELTFNGKATYQSDVISIQVDQPGLTLDFPEMPHEQFGLNLDLSQVIYDGGHAKSRRAYEMASTAVALQQVQVDLQALKQQVAGLYFSTLLLQANRDNFSIVLENLRARETVLLSAVENGIAEEADLQVIRVEILKTLQSVSELESRRIGALRALSVYMGQELDGEVFLDQPVLDMTGFVSDNSGSVSDNNGSVSDTNESKADNSGSVLELTESDQLYRPELTYLKLSSDLLDAGKQLHQAKRMPRLFAFGQAGVGMPGYNMLNDQVDSYYLVGAGVQWNIWDWNIADREQQVLEKQQQVLEHAQETFSIQVRAGLENELAQLEHYRQSLELDERMLEMRIGITAAAASKVDHGVISATEYLQVLNEEQLTRIARTAHQIRLLQSMANYHLLKGTL